LNWFQFRFDYAGQQNKILKDQVFDNTLERPFGTGPERFNPGRGINIVSVTKSLTGETNATIIGTNGENRIRKQ
jgi:hypothetical protein